ILDSGLTLTYLLKSIKARRPESVAVATLLYKQGKQQAQIDPRYVGFVCPDEFVVGYGLDYSERYRNLPYIGVLDEKVYT
ncbi:MAG: hypoxanthine phosphoribosyltransferase, partial [Coriobacteriales bacterium]|nr:hypoxanthine phosphoribosyltransferase [Coriobacteriales bacterium]